MKTLPLSPAILFLILGGFATLLQAAEPCQTTEVPAGDAGTQQINENFNCLDQKLSRILNLLEAQAAAKKEPEAKTVDNRKSAYKEKYNFTFRDLTVYLNEVTLKETAQGYQIVSEWSIRNLNKTQDKQILLISGESGITVRGHPGSFRTESDRIATCHLGGRMMRQCAMWDKSLWTVISPGRLHNFSIYFARPIKQKLTSQDVSLNARIMVRDDDG